MKKAVVCVGCGRSTSFFAASEEGGLCGVCSNQDIAERVDWQMECSYEHELSDAEADILDEMRAEARNNGGKVTLTFFSPWGEEGDDEELPF